MFAYGGFGIVIGPTFDVQYIGSIHQNWIENGGVFVSAHPRGGGEYGEAWYLASIGTKRQVGLDDVYAISEDLIEKGITSKGRISPIGGSHGGFMASAMLTQRPDLFGASIALVPLTDLTFGSSPQQANIWGNQYGDARKEDQRETILSYSPIHLVEPDKTLPEMLIVTSTRDERVHPGYARRFAAKIAENGHPVLFYETEQGGHGLALDDDGRALLSALQLVYLQQNLMGQK